MNIHNTLCNATNIDNPWDAHKCSYAGQIQAENIHTKNTFS